MSNSLPRISCSYPTHVCEIQNTVIWATPRFEYPHPQNHSDMGIPCNRNSNPNQNC